MRRVIWGRVGTDWFNVQPAGVAEPDEVLWPRVASPRTSCAVDTEVAQSGDLGHSAIESHLWPQLKSQSG